ncbi:MAG: hypothetical protein ACYC6L_15935 [Anaerolineae bacterium]
MPSDLATKLRLHTVKTILVLNVPRGFLEALGAMAQTVETESTPGKVYDYVQSFFTSRTALEKELTDLISLVRPDSLLWLCYPKHGKGISSDLNRDILAATVADKTEWRCISQIALDEVWSAMRARPKALVGIKFLADRAASA